MDNTEHIQLTERQQQWLAHFEAADQQALSLTDYAKQQNLDIKRLYSWKSQLKQKGFFADAEPATSFIKAQMSTAVNVSSTSTINIVLPNGVRLEVPSESTDMRHLIQALTAL